MQVTPADIVAVSKLVNELCGIVLDETKGYLIESRLTRLAEGAGCATFAELAQKAQLSSNLALRSEIIDAITTQETLFFRDASPYDALQYKAIPDLIDAKARSQSPKRLRLWSAACSTGQEPYSLAMVLSELIPDIHTWDVSILATDISNSAIRQASAGRYAKHEALRGMRSNLLPRYFTEDSSGFKIKDQIRALITFARRNLLEPFTELGPFDVIFCRNVAIYFQPPARRSVFCRLAERLVPQGYLFAGSSECLLDLGPQFMPQQYCRATFYQPNKKSAPAACGPVTQVVRKAEVHRPAVLVGT